MCGGTLTIDKDSSLAVCPYCGTKSTVYDQDRKLFEQFQTMFAALLNKDADAGKTEDGFWVEATDEELVREDGEIIATVSYTHLDVYKRQSSRGPAVSYRESVP